MALLSALATEIAIPVCAVIGIAFSLVQWWLESRNSDNHDEEGDLTQRRAAEDTHKYIKKAVSEGVKRFRSTGCLYVGVLLVAFVGLIFLILGSLESFSTRSRPCKSDPSNKCKPALTTAVFTAVSFLLGALTSVLSGFLGTKISISAIKRTGLSGRNLDGRHSIASMRSSAVVGFLPAGIGLLVLYMEINLFKLYDGNDWEGLFEAIAGYGVGGSSMALFGRASGGIFAKAADVCLHLVLENDPECPTNDQNAAVTTNYVGDIVGDIAGVGPDFFGSYVESCCAALVVASISSFGIKHDFTAMCYPLLISSMGILVGIFVCVVTILIGEIKFASKRAQLIISTILMTGGIVAVSLIALPPSFTVYKIESPKIVTQKVVKNWELSLCVAVGLWAGLIIEFDNIYGVRDRRPPFSCLPDDVASEVSVVFGSVSIPLFAAFSIYVSSHFAASYGIAVAALGMLSTISTRLAIDANGRISDIAERIAHMAREGALGAEDNPTADITERFAIESAALVSIALFGAFVSRLAVLSPADVLTADVLTTKVIIGLIMGAWLPSCFSSMTMKRAVRAGFEMADEVKRQIRDREVYCPACFKIVNDASFNGIIGPVALVMFAPFIVGTVFGVETLSGLLAGAFGSVQAGALKYARTLNLVSQEERRLLQLAEAGNTTGHWWKDTSGPPLNTLIQLMAVESLVLTPWFARHGNLLSKII